MFRIRRIVDDSTESDRDAIVQAQEILRAQFPLARAGEFDDLAERLRDPLTFRFRTDLFLAENARHRVRAVAILLHAPDLNFSYLDYITTAPGGSGVGRGSVLYQRLREEALGQGSIGLFFECQPDDPALSRDPEIRRQNAQRLRFYERFGARPIIGTAYETPLSPDGDNPPYLVLAPLGQAVLPGRDQARAIVRALLERKYGDICPPGYIDMVVDSFRDDPIRLRPPRYRRTEASPPPGRTGSALRIPLVVNDQHDIHHVRERGYVEAPVRIATILDELERTGLFERVPPRHFGDRHVRAVHDGALVDYLRRMCETLPPGRSVYPYVFPIRNATRPPDDLPIRAGYFCIDTFTPLNRNAYPAARRAVDCALTAAERVLAGSRIAYALVRPPGHHAERRAFGGFCYFNNAAVAAHYLSRSGRVAVLDIDYHHGNGTQDIFYARDDVLTVSIHGHPSFAYPYFTGFADERGQDRGVGHNLNLPLPEAITAERYLAALEVALARIARHRPAYLVLAVGFDTGTGDPTGSWPLNGDDFAAIGRRIGEAGLPTLVVQEGGYRVRTLGASARRFFAGLAAGSDRSAQTGQPGQPAAEISAPRSTRRRKAAAEDVRWRETVGRLDVESIRALVEATGFFSEEEVEIAAELVEEQLSRGPASGYHFLLGESGGQLLGYACWGPIAGTQGRHDLYWIAVHPDRQGRGLGREILRRVEQAVAAAGGRRIYVDTSTRPQYRPTRDFYARNGYALVAELAEFFGPGDGKAIYSRDITGPGEGESVP